MPIIYDEFREEATYLTIMDRIRGALIGVGCEIKNFKPGDLVNRIRIDGLEELMLATWAMNKHISAYLKFTNVNTYVPGSKRVGDIYTAVANIIKYCKPETRKHLYLSDEASDMEVISRACYAWLKSYRMLKNQKTNLFDWQMVH